MFSLMKIVIYVYNYNVFNLPQTLTFIFKKKMHLIVPNVILFCLGTKMHVFFNINGPTLNLQHSVKKFPVK